ncbi:hypothetical protein V8C86DRAFT_2446394, partial [Haematococcus lacustris]
MSEPTWQLLNRGAHRFEDIHPRVPITRDALDAKCQQSKAFDQEWRDSHKAERPIQAMDPAPDQTTQPNVEHEQQMGLGHLEQGQATEHEMMQQAQHSGEQQAEQQAVQLQHGQERQQDKVAKMPDEFDAAYVKKAHAQAIFHEFAPGLIRKLALRCVLPAWWELIGQFLKDLQAKAIAVGVPWDNNTFIPSEFQANVATAEDLKTTSANMTVMQPSAMEEEYLDIMGQSLRNLLDTAAKDVANAVGDASSSNVAMAPVVQQLKEVEMSARSAATSKRERKIYTTELSADLKDALDLHRDRMCFVGPGGEEALAALVLAKSKGLSPAAPDTRTDAELHILSDLDIMDLLGMFDANTKLSDKIGLALRKAGAKKVIMSKHPYPLAGNKAMELRFSVNTGNPGDQLALLTLLAQAVQAEGQCYLPQQGREE